MIPERETFSGRVRIDIRFDAATDGFWMHGRGLDVDKVSLHVGDSIVPATYQQVTRDGVVRISLAQPIAPQTAQLDISYRGRFSNLLEGLFREQVDGNWYAFTQFEPIDARGVFPGFDEPRFKTPFTLSIVAPKATTVAANTPIAEIATLPDDTKRVLFQPTPPLPTYLVAFAVGPLDVAEGGKLRDAADAPPLRGLARAWTRARVQVCTVEYAGDRCIARRLFRTTVSVREARPRGGAVAGRRDGERGADHVRRISRCCSARSRR